MKVASPFLQFTIIHVNVDFHCRVISRTLTGVNFTAFRCVNASAEKFECASTFSVDASCSCLFFILFTHVKPLNSRPLTYVKLRDSGNPHEFTEKVECGSTFSADHMFLRNTGKAS